jgi:plasmid stabilization system protein ParE
VSERSYIVRPTADRDLDFCATETSPEVGHRFLLAAHDTFALLATQPNMGWRSRLRYPDLKLLRVFRVYLPSADGVEISRLVHGSRNLQELLRSEGAD